MSKHSPGEWAPGSRTASGKLGRTIYAGHVAICNLDDRLPEFEANAHLIAAAPNLKEACRLARKFIRLDDVATCTPAEAEVLRVLDDALTKAEGEKP